jgi:ribose transport system ATP-binding protein
MKGVEYGKMKKEALRLNNLNYVYSGTRKLRNISFCIMEGEVTGFLGLTYSGKDVLVKMLCGELREDIQNIHLYLHGKKVTNRSLLKKKVYHIKSSNYLIDNWTVAEYIGLVDSRWIQLIWNKKSLEEETSRYFETAGVMVEVSKRLSELTELEKRIVDLVKAARINADVVIIEDEFEGMSRADISQLGKIMKNLVNEKMGVIINSYSESVLSILSERYIIFKEGSIVKKCRKECIEDTSHLEKFLLGTEGTARKKMMDQYINGQAENKTPAFEIRGLELNGKGKQDFKFGRGEVVTFLTVNGKERERLFNIFSGRELCKKMYFLIDSNRYESLKFEEFVREKVVSVMHMGSKEEVFAGMSPGENLLLPSIRKISSLEYITASGKMAKMIRKNMKNMITMSDVSAGKLEINELISLTLERWYIYNPKVLVLFEPFQQCDLYGVSVVKSYIKKFSDRGTIVLIVKSRAEYIEDISDHIISIE